MPRWRKVDGCGTTTSYRNGCRCSLCKEANNKYWNSYRKTEHGQKKANRITKKANLKRSFGLDIETYDQMLIDQKNLCAACGNPEDKSANGYGHKTLCVDHNHETGEIRGLLCMKCNRALGLLGDSAERCEALALYRKRYL